MTCIPKTVVLFFLAAMMNHALNGNAQGQQGACKLSDIMVNQEKTGKVVQDQPEYRVTIENLCTWPQHDVQLYCDRLPSVEPIDSRKIKVEDELCKVASALFKGSPVTFTYAWKTPQNFTVVSATASC
ncbi:hypothetical protein EJB05_27842 [Eragrostis curvula]|uniref:Uncharacterized protein n=1 Tax=Eragrostis curvula TaxID=38414 RepID=A0A5J9UQN0_9POAL|nr:hypothetical protein EJB05_27842 [Eragrostis curvula]